MDVKTYCANMKDEIAAWKAKTDDLIKNLDKRTSTADERTSNSIEELSAMIDDLSKKIDQLETECPADWSKEKAEVDRIISEMNEIWYEAAEMSPDDF